MIEQILSKELDVISFAVQQPDEIGQMLQRQNIRGNLYLN